MSFCMIFLISLTITSICLGRCGCIPYHYFGNGGSGVVNMGICGQSNVNGLKTLFKEVSETKSTVMNFPTRGLFYPDDMFFTNWAPRVLTTDCSEKQSSVTTPSSSILKYTTKITKNYEKTKILLTTVSQKNSSYSQKSSLGNKKTTLSLKKSPFDRQKSTRGHRMSTHTRLQKTTVDGQNFSDVVQISTKVHLQNSSRKLQKSSRDIQKSTTLRKSTRGSKKSSAIHQKAVEKSNVASTTSSFFDYYADDGEDTTIN